ncbi:MAG: bacterial transcriptional activator domain-containing protein, partial [Anaerolineae bacterium]|nr:bacterial transcriptional activator domain-containing protein [Anaerolineae bacterium]
LAIKYDVMEFVGALMAGRSEENPDRVAAWQKAIEMYRGPFLQGHNDTWIAKRRQDFLAGYLEALTEMARVRLADERPEQALGLFQKALSEDSTREDIHREIMQLYTKMGRRSEAAAHYQRLVDELNRNNQKPSPQTEKLYQEIMS